jgi:hypothetical protein
MLQPAESIIELCHVVTDMTSAIRYWTRVVGAGPFFVGDMEFAEGYRYRGRPCGLSLQIGFGFSGGLIVELVRPIDTRRDSGGFVELMDISPLIQRQLDNMARAHYEWDGISEPVRSMAGSFA